MYHPGLFHSGYLYKYIVYHIVAVNFKVLNWPNVNATYCTFFHEILMKLGHRVYLDDIKVSFEIGSGGVKNNITRSDYINVETTFFTQ